MLSIINQIFLTCLPPVNDEGEVIDDDSGSVVVSDTSDVLVGFNVRSFQGFDTTGIVIFEHQFYNGTAINYTRSNPDVSRAFPTNEEGGASSFIVNRGVWSLYTGQNYNGTMLTLEGRSQFTPGTVFRYLIILLQTIRSGRLGISEKISDLAF